MAFIIQDKQPGGGSGTISIGLAGEAKEIWTLIADGPNYGTEDVRASGLFPTPYISVHAGNSRLLFMPYEVEQNEENPALFICTLTWTSEPLTKEQQEEKEQSENDPLLRRAIIEVETGYEDSSSHVDFDGVAKVNAAGDLFDPTPRGRKSYRVIKIRKNVEVFPDWVFDYADAVNETDFTIRGRVIKAGTAWMAYVRLRDAEDGSTAYAVAEIELHVKKKRKPRTGETEADVPDPWKDETLNEGLHSLVGGEKHRIMVPQDDDPSQMQPVAAPVWLTSVGTAILTPTLGGENYIVTNEHEYLDFNPLSYLWS